MHRLNEGFERIFKVFRSFAAVLLSVGTPGGASVVLQLCQNWPSFIMLRFYLVVAQVPDPQKAPFLTRWWWGSAGQPVAWGPGRNLLSLNWSLLSKFWDIRLDGRAVWCSVGLFRWFPGCPASTHEVLPFVSVGQGSSISALKGRIQASLGRISLYRCINRLLQSDTNYSWGTHVSG